MICGMTVYQIAWLFLIYSFLGWVTEVIFHAVTLGKIINRGFLNGPVCPVYGFGVLSVFACINLLETYQNPLNDFLVFIFGVVLATLIELVAGWLLDICFHARWWDYSNKPLNFHGYICLEFSLIWGLAILLVVRVFQKYIENLFTAPNTPGLIILIVLYLCYLVDLAVTVATIQGFNKKLKQLDALSRDLRIISDKMSEKLGETTIGTAQTISEKKVQAALAKAELKEAVSSVKNSFHPDESKDAIVLKAAELQKKYEELTNSLLKNRLFGQGHLLTAFPNMKHKKYQNIISLLKERYREK